ncbi:uncharacterized protein LOC143294564 [Babylonia areolata]|uniref:uncharacterized protein LOC143294564 n=1 Tax=Babylonia areolata TaxID=304850 RepID=UPI003FD5177B
MMSFSQGFRVFNSLGKRHASKLWSAHRATVPLPSTRDCEHAVHASSMNVKSARSGWNISNRCHFSTDSQDRSLDAERHRLRNDPEIRAWMNQIAQDFDTAPFQALVDQPHDQKTDKSSSDGSAASAQTNSHIDVEEFGYIEDDEDDYIDPVPERSMPVSLERGQLGVFDVEEIIAVLEDENGVDIQVIDIPPEARFVDHMVVVSGKSLRHMRAMAASIEWLYKRKKRRSDRPFRLEGRDCDDWFAMDLGNIAVHIFMPQARQHYDLETLWTLGPDHDDQRHYVHDDSLNLSAADLFWLESGGSDEASSSHTTKDNKTSETDGCEGDMIVGGDKSSKAGSGVE